MKMIVESRADKKEVKLILSLIPYVKEMAGICYLNEQAGRQDGIPDVWSNIFKYAVPSYTILGISDGDTISILLCDQEEKEIDKDSPVRLIVRRDNLPDEVVYGPVPYKMSREFEGYDLLAKIGLPQPLLLDTGDLIIVQALSKSRISKIYSYFQVRTVKVRLYRDWGD